MDLKLTAVVLVLIVVAIGAVSLWWTNRRAKEHAGRAVAEKQRAQEDLLTRR